jgi:hypothetical protein
MGVFWRQGLPTEGGPADIMVRVGKKTTAEGSTGLRPEDMVPAVDAACRTSVYAEAKELANAPADNISSNTIPWSPVSCDVEPPADPANNIADTTSFNPYEDSRAHRAAIVTDDLYVGYSYVKDWAVGNYTDMDNYNFWLRKYNGTSGGWTVANNVSNISDPAINVKEPRLVKTPGNGPGCTTPADPDSITNPENCQDTNTLIVGWGTESNVYSHVETSEEFDIYYTRTRDQGATFEEPVVVPGIGSNNRFESQLRPTPAGNIVYTVWNEKDNTTGGTNAMLSVSDESDGAEPPPSPVITADDLFLSNAIAPDNIAFGVTRTVEVLVNNSSALEAVDVASVRFEADGELVEEVAVRPIDPGSSRRAKIKWTATEPARTVQWTMSLIFDGQVIDTATATTVVRD